MPETMVMLILRENDVIKVLMTSSSKGSPLKKVKIQSTPIGLKIGTGKFSTMPDTMVMLIFDHFRVIFTSFRYKND